MVPETSQPTSSRPTRRLVLLISAAMCGLLLVAVISTLIVFAILRSTVFSPTGATAAYLDMIESGRLSAAWSVDRADGLAGADALVAAPQSRMLNPMRDVTTTVASRHGDVAVVDVSYRVGTQHGTGAITLQRVGSALLYFDRWRIVRGLASTAQISASHGGEVTVAGAGVPVVDGVARVVVYPGEYALALGRSKWFVGDQATLLVTQPKPRTNLTVRPTDALNAEVERVVDARIDSCAKSTDPSPAACPFPVLAHDIVRDVSWQVREYPTVVVDQSGDGFDAGAGGLVVASYRFEEVPGGPWRSATETQPFWAAGALSVDSMGVHVRVLDH